VFIRGKGHIAPMESSLSIPHHPASSFSRMPILATTQVIIRLRLKVMMRKEEATVAKMKPIMLLQVETNA